MPLTFRGAQPEDFPQCVEIINDHFVFNTAKSRKELFSFWREILGDRSALSAVVEDSEMPAGKRIAGAGFSVFATDEFAAEALATLPPFLGLQIFKRWQAGKREKTFLNRKAIAHHNARGGLNLMAVHFGIKRNPVPELELPVYMKMLESLGTHHRGYRINQFLEEIYGLKERELAPQAGFVIRKDFADLLDQPLVRDQTPFSWGWPGWKPTPFIPFPLFLIFHRLVSVLLSGNRTCWINPSRGKSTRKSPPPWG